ncbi:MAG: outer membrane protein assembly factor BamC [Porticoccaceae bacterium]
MKIPVALMILAVALGLSGCGMVSEKGTFRDRTHDYLKAEEAPPLTLPEGVRADALGQIYVVPPIPETSLLDETTETPRPQPLSTNVLEEEVKIQSLNGQRWILINRSPSEAWPRVRNILNTNGVPTSLANATSGVVETVWIQFEDDPANDHRYRFSIEQGIQPDSTEIRILHASKPHTDIEAEWPGNSTSDEREASMAQILASALAGESSGGTVSLLAQSIGSGSKVEIVAPKEADPYIEMRLDYDRSWASVGYSVTRQGFTVVDQDRSAGVLYVNYRGEGEEEDNPGFFRRLLGAKSADEARLEVNYQVRVVKGTSGVEVRVLNAEDGVLERTEALRLLKKIRANLS